MNLPHDHFGRVLVLAAHPDDETIACAALLQRASTSLVVFAVDGAPPHYGFEKSFGSLARYSDARFQEASRALSHITRCSYRRLTRQNGDFFIDQHLFLGLPEAFTSLLRTAHEFQPDLLISHAFEGGHLDHDACHVLARSLARASHLRLLEFPLYWRSDDSRDVFQQFREQRGSEFVFQISPNELLAKRRMLAEYQTQKGLTSVFHPETERFRPVAETDAEPAWSTYPFENLRKPWSAELFFQKIAEFQRWVPSHAACEIRCHK